MSNTDRVASERASLSLQDVVEQLSEAVHRAVSITTLDRSVHVTSERKGAHLRAVAGPAAGIPALGSPHLTVEIHSSESLVGHLWVAGSETQPALGRAEREAVDSAVVLAAGIIDGELTTLRSSRHAIMGMLLSEKTHERRGAYAAAVNRQWLQRGQDTVVRAIMVDEPLNAVGSMAFGRYLAGLRPSPLWLVADRPGYLFAVGPRLSQETDQTIIDEGHRRGVRILGIGTASPRRAAEDLLEAADQAATAAELSASMSEFGPAVDIKDLGGWALLSAVKWDPAWLEVISPAAVVLTAKGNEMQRHTIETLLDVGGQVTAACEQLFVHRTTLYYRLEKMPTVVREAMADGMKRSTLHLALKLVRLWESSGRVAK
ncbi:helix-turn-helix domain-containing protein [Marisediminicola senii]|uniref:helix-turn-helix domain-containing protein n=1 Tax=Marisediminicola senii TaxID=2711233 RepID=UPI0013EAD2A3|nr:helix-turn-helix domain-containing protein [Marisediminicola senii]